MSKRSETFTKESYFCDQEIGGEQLSTQMDQRPVCPQPAELQCGFCGMDLCKAHDATGGRLASLISSSLRSYSPFAICRSCAESHSIPALVDVLKTEEFTDRKYAIKRAAIKERDA